jgi:hypothetical protein
MNAIRGKRAELDEIASARRALIAEGAAQAARSARSIKKAEEAAAIAATTHTLRHQCGNLLTRLPRCAR